MKLSMWDACYEFLLMHMFRLKSSSFKDRSQMAWYSSSTRSKELRSKLMTQRLNSKCSMSLTEFMLSGLDVIYCKSMRIRYCIIGVELEFIKLKIRSRILEFSISCVISMSWSISRNSHFWNSLYNSRMTLGSNSYADSGKIVWKTSKPPSERIFIFPAVACFVLMNFWWSTTDPVSNCCCIAPIILEKSDFSDEFSWDDFTSD